MLKVVKILIFILISATVLFLISPLLLKFEGADNELPLNENVFKFNLKCDKNVCQEDSILIGGKNIEASMILQDFVLNNLLNQLPFRTKDYKIRKFDLVLDKFHAISRDLNNDGEAEILGWCFSSMFSGALSEEFFILKKKGKKWELLSVISTAHSFNFQLVKRKDNKYLCINYDDGSEACYDELQGYIFTKFK